MTDRLTPKSQASAPPRAAAAAGLLFSLLMIVGLGIVRIAFPNRLAGEGTINPDFLNAVALAVNLVPFAGVAFLWFLGVVRNHIGTAEDQFFATVFLGSGLLFVASLFASAAVAEAFLRSMHAPSTPQVGRETSAFAREMVYAFLNIFGIKMAGVFICSTSMIALRTAIFPRWIVISGFACGLALLLVISNWLWIAMLFPLWTILVSGYILAVGRKQAGG
jgi:hypothetical protein